MAASTSVLAPSNSTNALFRLWGAAVDAAFLAGGWVQTADTGQINWTTVTAPVGANTAQGYTIWGTDDGLTTYYAKVEYGSGAAAATPAVWVTLGTGTNGSGTLSGQVGTRQQFASQANSTTTYNCHFGAGTGYFSCAMFSQTSSASVFGHWWCIERLLDNTGSGTSAGMVLYGTGAAAFHQVDLASGTNWTADAFVPTAWARAATNVSGTNVGVSPVFPMAQYHYPAALGAVGYYYNDIAVNTTFTLTRYGASRTYVAYRPSSTASPGSFGIGGPASYAVAVRYD